MIQLASLLTAAPTGTARPQLLASAAGDSFALALDGLTFPALPGTSAGAPPTAVAPFVLPVAADGAALPATSPALPTGTIAADVPPPPAIALALPAASAAARPAAVATPIPDLARPAAETPAEPSILPPAVGPAPAAGTIPAPPPLATASAPGDLSAPAPVLAPEHPVADPPVPDVRSPARPSPRQPLAAGGNDLPPASMDESEDALFVARDVPADPAPDTEPMAYPWLAAAPITSPAPMPISGAAVTISVHTVAAEASAPVPVAPAMLAPAPSLATGAVPVPGSDTPHAPSVAAPQPLAATVPAPVAPGSAQPVTPAARPGIPAPATPTTAPPVVPLASPAPPRTAPAALSRVAARPVLATPAPPEQPAMAAQPAAVYSPLAQAVSLAAGDAPIDPAAVDAMIVGIEETGMPQAGAVAMKPLLEQPALVRPGAPGRQHPLGADAELLPPASPAGAAIAAAALSLDTAAQPIRFQRPVDAVITPLAPAPLDTPVTVQSVAPAAFDAREALLDMRREEWAGEMVEIIETMREASPLRETRIRLAPDMLGNVDVSIRKDGDRVHVHFVAENPAARQMLQDAQPRLTEAAEQRGLRLGQTSVDAGAGQQGQRQENGQQPNQPARPASARAKPDRATQSDERIA